MIILLAALPLAAQTGTAVIKGTITDATQAAVPAAKLTLANTETNVRLGTESNELGFYLIGSLPPGRYNLVAEAKGFKKWSGNLNLQVGETAVINPAMEVGSVDTVVEVQDVTPIITTEGMAISDVKDSLRIQQLPLNGRSVSNLFNLTPGVEGGGNARVNGMKLGSLEILLDGASLVDRFGGGIMRWLPGLDTIAEFRIETTGSGAQYARPATVEMVTKGGTNQIHGAIFETHRNNAGGLRARARQDGNTAAKLIRNEYGASAGGPVFLPKLYDGRNKTFWFTAYEGYRERSLVFAQGSVPTPQIWAGDFSGIRDANNRQTLIYDPLTTNAQGLRMPFTGNVIPGNRLHPIYKTMESVTHLPTREANPFIGSNMDEFYPNVTNAYSLSAKIDHQFSDADRLSGRFTRSVRDNKLFGGRFGTPRKELTNGFGTGRGNVPITGLSIRENHIFRPNLFHDLLIVSQRTANSGGTLADFTDWATQLGFPNPFGALGWPTIGAGTFGWDADNRKDERLTAHNIESGTTWIKGKHSIKFGGKVRFEYNNIRELQQAQGSHTFGGNWTALYDPVADTAVSFTGNGIASMALGLPTFLSDQFNRGYFYFEQQEVGVYFNDSWKVTPRLTLDLGVRWDKWTVYKEKYNRLVNVDLATFVNKFEVITPKDHRMEDLQGIPTSVLASWRARGLTWKTAREAGFPDGLIPADNNNFGPRIGAAFRLTNRTVLRGGYGEYFWTMPLSQILQASRTNPPLNLRFTNPLSSGPDGSQPSFGFRTLPTADYFVGRATVNTTGIVTLPASAQGMVPWDAREWRDSRAQAWNVTIERELISNTALRLSYIGNHGRDLEQKFALNNQEPEFNYVARTGQNPPSNRDLIRQNKDWAFSTGAANHTGYSNTHSLQAEIEKRYTNGLAFQWFYVFTRSLTTTDAGGFTSGNGNINAVDGQFAVPENIQLLGAGNLSYDERLRLGYYNSSAIPAQRIRWNFIYDLPFGRGKKYGSGSGRALDYLIGGWQFAGIGDWATGGWRSVGSGAYLFGDPTLSADQRLTLTFNNRPQRLWFKGDFDPALATNVDQNALQALVPVNANRAQRVLHPLGAAFDNRLPQTLANGTVRLSPVSGTVVWNARAFFRGPGSWNQDVSVFKNIPLTERVKARFTADFFNFLNHPLDGNPNPSTGLQDLSTQPNS
ncbi:MAG: TonB-dependent receptor domain-containing protein, partial [Bryobacteraceae bacterium]